MDPLTATYKVWGGTSKVLFGPKINFHIKHRSYLKGCVKYTIYSD